MSYLEEFQKQGRALRARPKNKIKFIDLDDVESWKDTSSRAKRRKDDVREIEKQLKEFEEDFWKNVYK